MDLFTRKTQFLFFVEVAYRVFVAQILCSVPDGVSTTWLLFQAFGNMIWYIFNCKWVDSPWQWYSTVHVHKQTMPRTTQSTKTTHRTTHFTN